MRLPQAALVAVALMLAIVAARRVAHPYTHYSLLRRHTGYRIDLNTADAAAFALLPGIGTTLGHQIIAHRDAHGPFLRVEDLAQVKNIGPVRLERLRPWVEVGTKEQEAGVGILIPDP